MADTMESLSLSSLILETERVLASNISGTGHASSSSGDEQTADTSNNPQWSNNDSLMLSNHEEDGPVVLLNDSSANDASGQWSHGELTVPSTKTLNSMLLQSGFLPLDAAELDESLNDSHSNPLVHRFVEVLGELENRGVQLQKMMSKSSTFNAKWEASQSQLRKLQSHLQKATAANEILQVQATEMKEAQKVAHATAESEKGALTKAVKKWEGEAEKLTAQLRSTEQSLKKAKQQLSDRLEIDANGTKNSQIRSLEAKVASQDKRIASLLEEIKQLERDKLKQTAQFNSELQTTVDRRCEEILREWDATNQTHHHEMCVVKQKLDEVEWAARGKDNELERLNGQLAKYAENNPKLDRATLQRETNQVVAELNVQLKKAHQDLVQSKQSKRVLEDKLLTVQDQLEAYHLVRDRVRQERLAEAKFLQEQCLDLSQLQDALVQEQHKTRAQEVTISRLQAIASSSHSFSSDAENASTTTHNNTNNISALSSGTSPNTSHVLSSSPSPNKCCSLAVQGVRSDLRQAQAAYRVQEMELVVAQEQLAAFTAAAATPKLAKARVSQQAIALQAEHDKELLKLTTELRDAMHSLRLSQADSSRLQDQLSKQALQTPQAELMVEHNKAMHTNRVLINQLKQEVKQAEYRERVQQQEIDQLQHQLSTNCQKTAEEKAAIEAQLVQQHEKTVVTLKSKLHALKLKLKEREEGDVQPLLEHDLKSKKQETASLTKQVTEAEEANSQLRKRLLTLQEKLQAQGKEKSSLVENEIPRLLGDLEEMKKQSKTQQKQIVELEEANALLRKKAAQTEEKVKSANKETVHIQQAELPQLQLELEETRKQAKVLQKQIVELEEANALLRKKAAQTQEQVKSMGKENTHILQAELSLQQQLDESAQHTKALQRQVVELEETTALYRKKAAAEKEKSRLQKDKEDFAREEMPRLRTALDDLTDLSNLQVRQIKELEENNLLYRAKVAQLQEKLKTEIKLTGDMCQQENVRLQQELDEAVLEVRQAGKQQALLEQANKDVKKQLLLLREKQENAAIEQLIQQQDLQPKLQQLENSVKEIEVLTSQVNELHEVVKQQKNVITETQQSMAKSVSLQHEKELEVTRLEAVLKKHAHTEELRRNKDIQSFTHLFGRTPRKSSANDSTHLQMISIFDGQKQELLSEVSFLKHELSLMQKELQALRTTNKPHFDLQIDLDSFDEEREEMAAKQRELSALLEEERTKVDEITTAMIELEKTLSFQLRSEQQEFASTVAELENKLAAAVAKANAPLPPSTGPTKEDWVRLQEELYVTKRKLFDSETIRRAGGHHIASLQLPSEVDATVDADPSTRRKMKRDKQDHKLGLSAVSELPQPVLAQISVHLCRTLQLSDAAHIVSTVQRMKDVLSSLPALQVFVGEVCQLSMLLPPPAQTSATPATSSSSSTSSPAHVYDTVLATLRSIPAQIQQLRDLHHMHLHLSASLSTPAASSAPLSPGIIMDRVAALVSGEAEVAKNHGLYLEAKAFMQAHPDAASSKIVAHFQHLFSVPHMDGVLPKLNEIYLFVNGQLNYLQALRSSLGLGVNCNATDCLTKAQQLQEASLSFSSPSKGEEQLDNTTASEERFAQSLPASLQDNFKQRKHRPHVDSVAKEGEKQHADHVIKEQGQEVDGENKSLQAAAANHRILVQLKSVLMLSNASSLVSVVSRLVKRAEVYNELFPKLDALVAQLYQALQVNDLQSIVPAVHALLKAAYQTQRVTEAALSSSSLSSSPSVAAAVSSSSQISPAASTPFPAADVNTFTSPVSSLAITNGFPLISTTPSSTTNTGAALKNPFKSPKSPTAPLQQTSALATTPIASSSQTTPVVAAATPVTTVTEKENVTVEYYNTCITRGGDLMMDDKDMKDKKLKELFKEQELLERRAFSRALLDADHKTPGQPLVQEKTFARGIQKQQGQAGKQHQQQKVTFSPDIPLQKFDPLSEDDSTFNQNEASVDSNVENENLNDVSNLSSDFDAIFEEDEHASGGRGEQLTMDRQLALEKLRQRSSVQWGDEQSWE